RRLESHTVSLLERWRWSSPTTALALAGDDDSYLATPGRECAKHKTLPGWLAAGFIFCFCSRGSRRAIAVADWSGCSGIGPWRTRSLGSGRMGGSAAGDGFSVGDVVHQRFWKPFCRLVLDRGLRTTDQRQRLAAAGC